jgi:hypothetical protein
MMDSTIPPAFKIKAETVWIGWDDDLQPTKLWPFGSYPQREEKRF